MSKLYALIGILCFAGFGFGGYLAIVWGDRDLFTWSLALYVFSMFFLVIGGKEVSDEQ